MRKISEEKIMMMGCNTVRGLSLYAQALANVRMIATGMSNSVPLELRAIAVLDHIWEQITEDIPDES